LVAFLFQGTWALAGVTGNLAGVIHDNTGAPVAGATVQAVSPSQTSRATTDAGGHFIFLAMTPDTYTLNVTKDGYQPTSFPGNTVFADQTQQLALVVQKSLRLIAHVTASAPGSLVKSGVGGDIYSVNAAQAQAAAALGGGGNLNSTYSALASVPGVQQSIGEMGWNQATFVRGQNSYFTGFEYDGIPVNRAFDNYVASTESTLGLQELQVYTGGGPASISSSGTSGFINQVIKTGTYPGFANIGGAIGTPTFYHQAQVEAGGSTPDRNFSYYVGLSGYNQGFRILDNTNAAGYANAPNVFALYTGVGFPGAGFSDAGICNQVTGASPKGEQGLAWGSGGCWLGLSGIVGNSQNISDRENVVNLHFGINRADGLRDDIQALWSASALGTQFYDTPTQYGLFPYVLASTGSPYCPNTAGCTGGVYGNPSGPYPYNPQAPWLDSLTYNKPFGTTIATPTSSTAPSWYYFPSSPGNRAPFSPAASNLGSGTNNDTGVVKLQYTHALSSSAFIRAFAYSFYSDWLENDPTTFEFVDAPDYELITHTAGGELQFADQIGDKNLVTLTGNYTTANVTRWNNGTVGAESPIGYWSGSGASMTCYNPGNTSTGGGGKVPCIPSDYWDTKANGGAGAYTAPSWISNAGSGPTGFGGPANASWNTLWAGQVTGSLNTVDPKFTSVSLSDQWRPSDQLMFDGAIRYDNYVYDLPNSVTPATSYYASVMENYTCYNTITRQLLTAPVLPSINTAPPPPPFYINGDCNQAVDQAEGVKGATGWVHPNGKVQDGVAAPLFSDASPASYGLSYWSPRISATYTESPDTVWRFSAGRFVQPPLSAAVQYLSASGDDRSVWASSMNLGFFTPFHPVPAISSAQYDGSFEHHFRGTDMSLKLTPFYTDVTNWQTQVFIGKGFVTQVPYGTAHNAGAEFEFDKGDFSRNGWSGKLAVTYTSALVQFNQGTGGAPNQISVLNNAITYFNQLTKSGGGAPCYTPANPSKGTFGTPTNKCTAGSGNIKNPYYNMAPQPLLDTTAWYNVPAIGIGPSLNYNPEMYNAPWVSTLIANYRHNALAITPSIQFQSGTRYGTPMDVTGVDPRSCAANSLTTKVPGAGTQFPATQCNYTTTIAPGASPYGYLYIPNPQTGTFASYGQYTGPNIIVGNLAVAYDLSSKVRLQLTATNLFHDCFGGSSEPWTAAYPPGGAFCSYVGQGNSFDNIYVSNFYNGTGPGDKKANGVTPQLWQLQSYGPGTGLFNVIPPPLNLYIGAQVKL
jgi:hypothetical protein